jgi:hypothetical protein
MFTHRLPLSRDVRSRDGGLLAQVERDVLRSKSELERSLLRVVSSSSEQTRGLDSEVSNLLFSTVEDAVLIDRFRLVSSLLDPVGC